MPKGYCNHRQRPSSHRIGRPASRDMRDGAAEKDEERTRVSRHIFLVARHPATVNRSARSCQTPGAKAPTWLFPSPTAGGRPETQRPQMFFTHLRVCFKHTEHGTVG